MGTTVRALAPMLVLLAASPALAAPAAAPPLPAPRPADAARAPARALPDDGPLPAPLPPPRPVPEARDPAQPTTAPLPPPRPVDLRPPAAQAPPGPPVLPPARSADRPPEPVAGEPSPFPGAVPPDEAHACVRLFRGGKVEAQLRPAIWPAGLGCGIGSPVEIADIVLDPGGARVRFEPPITVGCAMGNAVAAWVRDELAPAFAATGSPLVALTGTSGYACRGRNGVAGAKPSEHGLGHAVDIGGFVRADRTAIDVQQADAPVLATVRATACARFATVLGPGSDGFHEAHMHVDIEERRNRFAICHWDRL